MINKILIINSGSLFPKVMASQDRVINLSRVLNKKNEVDIITLYSTEEEKQQQKESLKKICTNFYLLQKPNNTFLKKKIYGIIFFIIQKIILIPKEMIYPNWPSIRKKIFTIIRDNHYDIVQIEGWWQCSIFKKIQNNILKVVDTHDVMHQKRKLEYTYKKNGVINKWDQKFLKSYENYEIKYINYSDLVISITNLDKHYFQKQFPNKKHILIPTGQNIDYFLNYPVTNSKNTILFYGSMGGQQNVIAFWRLYNNIFPLIKQIIPDIKLIVLGANPPVEILKLDNGGSIKVTGYVNDVREFISKSSIMILPLITGGGFRSRLVEVMAMGVPVIGTKNALCGFGLTNGLNCIIEDDDVQVSLKSVNLLMNPKRLKEISLKCKEFVIHNFSIKKTYGKLLKYYSENI